MSLKVKLAMRSPILASLSAAPVGLASKSPAAKGRVRTSNKRLVVIDTLLHREIDGDGEFPMGIHQTKDAPRAWRSMGLFTHPPRRFASKIPYSFHRGPYWFEVRSDVPAKIAAEK